MNQNENKKSKIIIKNKENLIEKIHSKHELYQFKKYEVTKRSDFNQCYVAIYEIPPKKANYPSHYHEANTEVFYIISGNGILETIDGNKEIKSGDVIVCPPKKEGTHRIINISETEYLKYIDFDTTNSPDIIHYINSDKIGVIVHNESSTFFKNGAKVDYYDGE